MNKNIRLPFRNLFQPSGCLPLAAPEFLIFTGCPTHQAPVYMIENRRYCRRVKPPVIIKPQIVGLHSRARSSIEKILFLQSNNHPLDSAHTSVFIAGISATNSLLISNSRLFQVSYFSSWVFHCLFFKPPLKTQKCPATIGMLYYCSYL